MQIEEKTRFHVVSSDGATEMTFEHLVNAVKGGMKLDEVEIFTDAGEAKAADQANYRRRMVRRFGRDEMLNASKLVLLDSEDAVIAEIPFCPLD